MGRYQIQIDSTLCSGYGACAELAPKVIALDKHGQATAPATATDDEAVLEAAAACPMGAIAVYDTLSGRQAA